MKKLKKIIKMLIKTTCYPFLFFKYNCNKSKKINKIIKNKANSFFGYYNKSPWNKSQTKIITLTVENANSEADNSSKAFLTLIDTENFEQSVIAETNCWNTQQGCMAQWVGPDYESKIIFNDFENGNYVSKIYDLESQSIIKTFEMPIYDISSDGKFALTLDFSRLHEARPGYGYCNKKCSNANEKCPDETCIWKIDLITGKINSLITYKQLFDFDNRKDMIEAFHKVNHIVINPSNTRFMFLHRWSSENKKISRLITCDIDGSNMYNLSDDNMVSHCCWKNETEILGFLRKKNDGNHYYLLKDKKKDYKIIWKNITEDGHCTYDYSGGMIVSDTYPNIFGVSKVFVGRENDDEPKVIAKFYSPPKYKDDVRCDLHPRWSYDGKKISVDSVNDGYKKIYSINYKN